MCRLFARPWRLLADWEASFRWAGPTARANVYPPPTDIGSEHCPPLTRGEPCCPNYVDECSCGNGPGACVVDGDMQEWLARELAAASDADPLSDGFNSTRREPNNKQRKRCYRRAAIEFLHYEFRQPLPGCLVAEVRRVRLRIPHGPQTRIRGNRAPPLSRSGPRHRADTWALSRASGLREYTPTLVCASMPRLDTAQCIREGCHLYIVHRRAGCAGLFAGNSSGAGSSAVPPPPAGSALVAGSAGSGSASPSPSSSCVAPSSLPPSPASSESASRTGATPPRDHVLTQRGAAP